MKNIIQQSFHLSPMITFLFLTLFIASFIIVVKKVMKRGWLTPNIDYWRSSFLGIGFFIALACIINIFNWTTCSDKSEEVYEIPMDIELDEIIPQTVHLKPKPPMPLVPENRGIRRRH